MHSLERGDLWASLSLVWLQKNYSVLTANDSLVGFLIKKAVLTKLIGSYVKPLRPIYAYGTISVLTTAIYFLGRKGFLPGYPFKKDVYRALDVHGAPQVERNEGLDSFDEMLYVAAMVSLVLSKNKVAAFLGITYLTVVEIKHRTNLIPDSVMERYNQVNNVINEGLRFVLYGLIYKVYKIVPFCFPPPVKMRLLGVTRRPLIASEHHAPISISKCSQRVLVGGSITIDSRHYYAVPKLLPALEEVVLADCLDMIPSNRGSLKVVLKAFHTKIPEAQREEARKYIGFSLAQIEHLQEGKQVKLNDVERYMKGDIDSAIEFFQNLAKELDTRSTLQNRVYLALRNYREESLTAQKRAFIQKCNEKIAAKILNSVGVEAPAAARMFAVVQKVLFSDPQNVYPVTFNPVAALERVNNRVLQVIPFFNLSELKHHDNIRYNTGPLDKKTISLAKYGAIKLAKYYMEYLGVDHDSEEKVLSADNLIKHTLKVITENVSLYAMFEKWEEGYESSLDLKVKESFSKLSDNKMKVRLFLIDIGVLKETELQPESRGMLSWLPRIRA